jgi:hypothetical protein
VGVVEVVLVAGLLGVVRTTVRGLPDPGTVFEARWRWFRVASQTRRASARAPSNDLGGVAFTIRARTTC